MRGYNRGAEVLFSEQWDAALKCFASFQTSSNFDITSPRYPPPQNSRHLVYFSSFSYLFKEVMHSSISIWDEKWIVSSRGRQRDKTLFRLDYWDEKRQSWCQYSMEYLVTSPVFFSQNNIVFVSSLEKIIALSGIFSCLISTYPFTSKIRIHNIVKNPNIVYCLFPASLFT